MLTTTTTTTTTCASMDFCNQFLVAALVVLGLLPLASEAQTDFSVTTGALSTWNQSEWSLESTKLVPGQYQSRLSLANGYVGASLAQIGPFFERDINQSDPTGTIPINGWPLFDERISFSTISGFFNVQQNTTGNNYQWLSQYGWDSFIAGIPHTTAIIYSFNDQYLDATVSNTTISNFSSKLSFKTGVAEWAYTWTPANTAASFNITYNAIFSRQRPNVIAVKSTIVPSADIKGTVTDLLDGRSAARSYLDTKGIDQNGPTIYSIFHPTNLPQVTGAVVSGVNFSNGYTDISSRTTAQGAYVSGNETTIGQSFSISLKAGQTATFFKYVGVASSDKFSNPESTARQQQAQAASSGWDTLLSEHVAAWAALLTEDSVDDFSDPITGELPDDQLIEILHVSSVANPFYILQNMQPRGSGLNDDGISVGGLVSDSYSGQVFWDMDYWMAPGLNLAFPEWAEQITNFRVKQHPQALANAAFNNFPNGSALYSWTAGRYGNCTATGPCVDYQYHLNYDIIFNMQQLKAVTGNNSWFEGGPQDVFNSAVLMTSHLLEYNETTQTYWIHNMTDPDEYANMIDNGAFTLASATDLLQQANSQLTTQGQSINQTWEAQQNVEFPKADSGITLEFTGMNNSAAVKQADVVLLAYPLDYLQNYSTSEKLLDLDYYANRQSPNGPAMTYSVFAVVANALSPSGCSAFTYTLGGTLSYLRGPWYQFSEQAVDDASINGGTNPAFPFLTGHGGANQIVPFGFLGIRTDQPVLYINPSLPPQIPQVRVRTIHYAGATLSFFINQTHTTITRFVTPQSKGLVDAYANTPFPFKLGTPSTSSTDAVSYTITTNQTITVPNRLYWKTLTNAGNLLQCLPVSSTDSYAAGQFPVAANDGASSTDWQPASNESASIIINMTTVSPSPISGIFIDWAARPPLRATVYLGNSTETTDQGTFLLGNEAVISLGDIAANLPYNATAAAESLDEVVPVVGNMTSIDVTGAWSGNYARLVIEGCLENDGDGATVAEFVLIGANSPNSSSTVSSATATIAAESTSLALSNATPSATGTATGSAPTSTRRSAASREVTSGGFKLLAVMLVGVLIGMI